MGKTHKTVRDFPAQKVLLNAYDTRAKNGESGLLAMLLQRADVTQDGVELGYVGAGQGVIVVSVKGGPYFQILLEDIWEAVAGDLPQK